MLCDGKLYCDLLDVDTHEVLDSVVVEDDKDIVFQPMLRTAAVAIQFRASPRLVTGPVEVDRGDGFVIKDGAWGIHFGALITDFWDAE